MTDRPITLPGYRPDLHPVTQQIAAGRRDDQRRQTAGDPGRAGRVVELGAMQELREFAEKTHTPVAMTLLGMGALPASHPLNLGMMGMHGEAWVNHAIQEADLLLAFGMRFDDRVTGNLQTYAPNASKIHIDIDPSEINKNVKVDLGLVGDLQDDPARRSCPLVEPMTMPSGWTNIERCKGDSAVRDILNLPDDGHLYAAHVINDLWRYTNGEALIVTDVGQHQMWTAQYYHQDTPINLITSGGLGTMGFGLPAAIGAKFARPEKEVWVDRRRRRLPDDRRPSFPPPPRKTSRSMSPSSTMATWAWCASGRSSSTRSATPPPPCAAPIS